MTPSSIAITLGVLVVLPLAAWKASKLPPRWKPLRAARRALLHAETALVWGREAGAAAWNHRYRYREIMADVEAGRR